MSKLNYDKATLWNKILTKELEKESDRAEVYTDDVVDKQRGPA